MNKLQVEESEKEKKKVQVEDSIITLINCKGKLQIKKARFYLLKCDFSDIEDTIKTKNIKELLVLKHTLNLSKINAVDIAVISTIVTVLLPLFLQKILPEFIVKFVEAAQIVFSRYLGLFVILCYPIVFYLSLKVLFHVKFLNEVKIDVIISLIDIEIENKKKVQVKKTASVKTNHPQKKQLRLKKLPAKKQRMLKKITS